ncbi:LOW QUALITY PROTEIN: WD domain-containing protein [Colletotrichum tofieldiae]|nr:LOW QUALITY PROTEIN: WD domain-containing protein [Colletotrichum tofieldiae]
MQTLAPIHLLPPRPDGSLDHWRGAYWGMNNPAAYTPLESLFLFQAILKHGVEAAAFTKVSDLLVNNALIKDDKTYDARRLSPDALRQLFLHLLQEELRSENATADKPDGTLSPNSKKRKLNRPPLPTLKEVKEQLHKLPALVDRLYARYKDHVVKGVREDERRIEILAREVQVLEAHEAADRAKANAPRQVGPNGTSGPKTIPTPVPIPSPIPTPAQAAAHPQVKPPTPTPPAEAPRPIRPASGQASAPTQTPVPIPTPVPLPPQAHARPPANAAPVPPTAPQPTPARRDVAPPTGAFQPPPVAPPAQAAMAAGAPATTSSTAPAVKQHPPPKLPNSAGQVLQPPNSAGHPPVRPVYVASSFAGDITSTRQHSEVPYARTGNPCATLNARNPQVGEAISTRRSSTATAGSYNATTHSYNFRSVYSRPAESSLTMVNTTGLRNHHMSRFSQIPHKDIPNNHSRCWCRLNLRLKLILRVRVRVSPRLNPRLRPQHRARPGPSPSLTPNRLISLSRLKLNPRGS